MLKSSFDSRARIFSCFLHELDVDLDVDVEETEVAMHPNRIESCQSRRTVDLLI